MSLSPWAGWASVAPQHHALVSHDLTLAISGIAWNSSANDLGGAVGAAGGSILLRKDFPATWLPVVAIISIAVALGIHVHKLR